MSFWLRYCLQKGMEYREKDVRINITPCTSSGFSIYLCPDTKRRSASMYLHVGFSSNRITIQDLCGNGDGSPYQNQGYGTLLFNLALQVIRLLYEDSPDERVVGDVCNKGDIGDLDESAKRRNHFWSSFGFVLDDPLAHNTYMAAPLNQLKMVDRGAVQGHIPTTLSLSKFERYFNRALIALQDRSAIEQIDLEEFDFRNIPERDQIDTLFVRSSTQVRWVGIVLSVCVLALWGVWGGILQLSTESLFNGFAILAAILFLAIALYSYKIAKVMPAYRKYKRLSRQRSSTLFELKQKAMSMEQGLQGALWRAYTALKPLYPSLSDQEPELANRCVSSDTLSADSIEAYCSLAASIQAITKTPFRLGTDPKNDFEDFILGKITGSVSYDRLRTLAQETDSTAFLYQLNRVLKKCDQNRLVVVEGTSHPSGFDHFVSHIAIDVTFIEFYLSDDHSEYTHLYMRFYLSEGCLDLRASLTVRKMTRAEELAFCLRSLYKNELIVKTFVDVDQNGFGRSEKVFMPTTPKEIVMEAMCFLQAWWMTPDDIEYLTQLFKAPGTAPEMVPLPA